MLTDYDGALRPEYVQYAPHCTLESELKNFRAKATTYMGRSVGRRLVDALDMEAYNGPTIRNNIPELIKNELRTEWRYTALLLC